MRFLSEKVAALWKVATLNLVSTALLMLPGIANLDNGKGGSGLTKVRVGC